MTSKEIRDSFLRFFESKQHNIVPSAPMVVKDDPTLMFTNAGMNQFKDWFLGNTKPAWPRVADTQKCLRVSGKHNDLEEVGHDSYHHTMFEMLGNWSFGDYFKKEAIDWAWELLTEVYKLDKSRLYATVFEGSEDDNLTPDTEALNEWQKYLPDQRILYGNKKDNFWEMGESGPCGPCSEIHIDLRDQKEREKTNGAMLVNTGNPLVVEIWNLVFIQYNRKANGQLVPLPEKHVDTGMGLERLCMAMQGKKSNYDTDVFTGIISEICSLSGKQYGKSEEADIAMRVIADHIRAISFSIADGQLPSNVKAGYVIRRILRRAVRYGYTFLEISEPLLCRLVPVLVKEMGDAFPELKAQQGIIEKVIREEEESFLRTLDKGIKLMDTLIVKNSKTKNIPGEEAFILYDTYGFPIDLTELIAREKGYTIDIKGFEEELVKQKERSRKATSLQEEDWVEIHPYSESVFVGYEKLEEETTILKYRRVKAKNKEFYQIVLDRSPFYAESGGQVGDTGTLTTAEGEVIYITNTIKENNLNIHIAEKIPSSPAVPLIARVNEQKRKSTENNHTATHLLHSALRTILGNHIEQKGSLVAPDHFRFDFSHFEKISEADLRKVENLVNRYIRDNNSRNEIREVPVEKAKEMGAIALFGEKYSSSVRVIRFGNSIELCGGTHTSSTGNIGLFKIISESAIAAGVRRIEATTGAAAEKIVEKTEDALKEVKSLLGNTPNVSAAISKLVAENESLKKTEEEFRKDTANRIKEKLLTTGKKVNNTNIYILKGEHNSEVVKNVAFALKKELKQSAFIAGYTEGEKAVLTLLYTDDMVQKGYDAAKDIKEVSSLIRGGGGGQSFYATAGGKNKEGIDYAIEKLTELASKN